MKAEILEIIYEENKKGKDASLVFLLKIRGQPQVRIIPLWQFYLMEGLLGQ